jgi:hypothetical protein
MTCMKCGHLKKDHDYNKSSDAVHFYCWECLKRSDHTPQKTIHKFEDNLSYIERLSKERNLV